MAALKMPCSSPTGASIFPPRKFARGLPRCNPSASSFLTRCSKSSRNINYTRSLPIKSQQLGKLCAKYAAEKKAEDIVALDLREISSFTDFFVICSGTSEPHIKAIASEIQAGLKKDHDVKP